MKWERSHDRWKLTNEHGVVVAIARGCMWYTYRADGKASEEGLEDNVDAARAEATCSVVRQRLHELRPTPEGIDSRAVSELVCCLHLYPTYVSSRGPIGCIYRALEELSPQLMEQIREEGPDVVYDRYFAEEDEKE